MYVKEIDSLIKVNLNKVSVSDLYENVSKHVPTEREKQKIIDHLPKLIDSILLHEYILLVDFSKKDQAVEYLKENGLYPSFIEETFKWSL